MNHFFLDNSYAIIISIVNAAPAKNHGAIIIPVVGSLIVASITLMAGSASISVSVVITMSVT